MKGIWRFVVPAFGILASSSVFACSCAHSDPDQRYRESSQVFLAKVIPAREIIGKDSWIHMEATIKIVEVFKGTPRDGDVLRSGVRPRTYCEIDLIEGQVYVIYLGASNWVGICNSHRYDAEDDLAEIAVLRALRDRK